MKFRKKTQLSSDIPTSSMPDIIFMLLIFFMVTTVLRTHEGLKINLPKATQVAKLESKRNTAHVWIGKAGEVSIDDKLHQVTDVRNTMYQKRVEIPQIVVSMKADKESRMGLIVAVQNELRKADCLKLNYSTLVAEGGG